MNLFSKTLVLAVVVGLALPQASDAYFNTLDRTTRVLTQDTSVYQRLSIFERFSNLPKIWENGWVRDGDVVSTNAPYTIAAFTVSTEERLEAANSRFVIKSNTKRIGDYLTNVELVDDNGNRYPARVNAGGHSVIIDEITIEPGMHDFYIRAEFAENIPQNTTLQTVLKNSRVKGEGRYITPRMFGKSLPLQEVVVKY